IITVTKADYLANIKHLLAKAEAERTFIGYDHAKLRPHKKQMLTDLFNALGWNTGRMRTTAFDAADAWWLDDAEEEPAPAPQPEPAAPQYSLDHIKGVPAMKALFLAIRRELPCWNCPDPGYTYIWDGHVKQFRLKCTQCGFKLNQGQAREFILHMVAADELLLPEEFQPAEAPRLPTPPAEMALAERLPTPEAPEATTTMQLRSRTLRQRSPSFEMVLQLELPFTPMLDCYYPLRPMVEVSGLQGVKQSTGIAKDGNCLFRAMAQHLYGAQDRHMEVRAKTVAHLLGKPHLVAAYAAEGSGHLGATTWLTQMAKMGTWGDELAILGLAEAYDTPLWVYSDQHAQPYLHHIV
ncbi:Ovarian tumor, otubain, partial [Kalmanozyma brasiliensis GHG001]|uniref:Ovarian tumor, otubain n=1 Tax=Kalmanozyma brasiliensis (strain GHG001) TaxID=1365824 RepID=UPI00286805B7